MKDFYLHIDALLDTRLGVIERLKPGHMKELIANGYHKRMGDFFKGIDPIEYRQMYERHEVETLEHSIVTNVLEFLRPQVLEIIKDTFAFEQPLHKRPQIDVNVWPYDLDQEEKDFIGLCVHSGLKGMVGVKVISEDYKDLLPEACANNYAMMVMYDYHDYINAHGELLVKKPRPDLLIAAPMVYFNEDPETSPAILELRDQGINSLAVLESAISPRLGLTFINVEVFSLIYPRENMLDVDEKADEISPISLETLDKKLRVDES